MRIAVEHVTRYRYATPAGYSIQSLRLWPSSFDGQKVVEWRLSSEPMSEMTRLTDGFGNEVRLMSIAARQQEIVIVAAGTVEVEDRAGVVQGLAESVPHRVFLRRTLLTEPSAEIDALARDLPSGDPIGRLHALMGRIRDHVDYLPGVTGSGTTAAEAYSAGKGVCQDHAHIFITAARVSGVPARYVTGYLVADGEHAAHHAWAEAFIEGLGWVGFDAANRMCPTDHYVRMAASLDAYYAAPIRGSRRGGEGETLEVAVSVAAHMSQQ